MSQPEEKIVHKYQKRAQLSRLMDNILDEVLTLSPSQMKKLMKAIKVHDQAELPSGHKIHPTIKEKVCDQIYEIVLLCLIQKCGRAYADQAHNEVMTQASAWRKK